MIRSFGAVTGVTNQPQGWDVGLGGSNIKSVQRGNASIGIGSKTLNVSLATIDMTKAIINCLANVTPYNSTPNYVALRGEITSNTQATFNTFTNQSGGALPFSYEIIEFNNVKSLQRGTFVGAGADTNIALSAINLAKSMVFINWSSPYTSAAGIMWLQYYLSSSTNLLIKNHTYIDIGAYQVIEFI